MKASLYYGSFACLILAIIGGVYAFSDTTSDPTQLMLAKVMAAIFGVLFLALSVVAVAKLKKPRN